MKVVARFHMPNILALKGDKYQLAISVRGDFIAVI